MLQSTNFVGLFLLEHIIMKKCIKCGIEKEFEDFHKNTKAKDGLCHKCKNCVKEYKKENREKINQRKKEYREENKEQIKEYHKKYQKEHQKEYRLNNSDKLKEYYEENKEEIRQYKKEYWENNKIKLSERRKEYYENNRIKLLEQQEEYRKENKEKISQINKKYREKNKEKIRQQKKEYRLNNPDKMKEYREENREKLKQQRNEYQKEKIKNDPIFRLQKNLRSLNRRVLKYGYKSASTQELLGCTWEEAIIYIESLFLPGMTWDNWARKGWHLDHIKPLAAFTDLTDPAQQRECCHFTNLRPLWAEENLKKSSIHNGIKHYNKKYI